MADVFSITLLGSKGETVEPWKFSKPVEFDGFKIRIVQTLPYSLDGSPPAIGGETTVFKNNRDDIYRVKTVLPCTGYET